MAGSDSRFDAAKVRSALHFAMSMAFPGDTSKQITWLWKPSRTFNKTADSGGQPFDWTAADIKTEVDIEPMTVLCALNFKLDNSPARVGGTALGIMNVASGTVTMLDVDHDALVAHGGRFPDQAKWDDGIYNVQITAPPYALFDMTVWDVYIQAPDIGGD